MMGIAMGSFRSDDDKDPTKREVSSFSSFCRSVSCGDTLIGSWHAYRSMHLATVY